MASAIVGGLLKQGMTPEQFEVVEPFEEQRRKLLQQFGLQAQATAGPALLDVNLVVWAVKPQMFKEAAQQAMGHIREALHLSVAAGVRSASIARWLETDRIVRAMPNTPALVGKGMTALFARTAASDADCATIESVITTTGAFLWLANEDHLDAVTAISGSGPAYVFYFMEAMMEAGRDMGLSPEHARQLAVGTFMGSSALAMASDEAPATLRAQVTSKGGTTYAAIASMEADQVKTLFKQAMHAAHRRAKELGDEFGD